MVSRADAIYLDLLGTTAVSIGCVAELSWAWAHQIHTIVSVDRDNIHWHAFVIEMADIILPRPEAIAYLNKLAKGEE
jgi:hypothetical protein